MSDHIDTDAVRHGDPQHPTSDSCDIIADLRGHDLACWCPLHEPCHADVLLEIANAADHTERNDER